MTDGNGTQADGGTPRTGPRGPLTYAEVGAAARLAREGGTPPPGYHHFSVSTRVGTGRPAFEAAGAALLEWRMHRAIPVAIDPATPAAAPGVEVVVGLGPGPLRVRAPCRVVSVVRESGRTGFAYGTLPGHPERGEEAFLVELRGDGSVWLTVSAFSVAEHRWVRLLGPLARLGQRVYAKRCGTVLRQLAREAARRAASGA
jgi:uncharacterized protein (UPF0548 family)